MDALDSLTGRVARAIRHHRQACGLTLSDLAAATGLSKTILGRIENGRGNPSLETLFRVARALEVPLATLLAEEPPEVRFLRARSGAALDADSGLHAWLIHAQARGARTEIYELELAAGVDHRSEGHLLGTEELVYCLAGTLSAGPVGAEVELGAGDCAWFRADDEHRYVSSRGAGALNLIATRTAE